MSEVINKQAVIQASASRVWEVLWNDYYTKQWADAFSEGTYVETDWKTGSEVVWKDATHGTGARGIVITHEPSALLEVAYFDDVDSNDPLPEKPYTEFYKVSEQGSATVISIEAGPLEEEHISEHATLWDKALSKIKALAEAV